MYSEQALSWTVNPERVWRELDSFWRTHTAPTTRDVVRVQTIAQYLAAANLAESAALERRLQLITPEMRGYRPLFFPLVVYRHMLNDLSYVLLDSGLLIDSPPEFLIGEPGAPRFEAPCPADLRTVGTVTDAVFSPRVVLGPHDIWVENGKLRFTRDPFDIFTPQTDNTGSEFVLLWLRRPLMSSESLALQVGWLLRMKEKGALYTDVLRPLYDLVALGFSLGRYRDGVAAALGYSFAAGGETVVEVTDDGYRRLVITDRNVYAAPLSAAVLVAPGDQPSAGSSLTDCVQIFEGAPLLDADVYALPGLALTVNLSTGYPVGIVVANLATEWSYAPGRPSPWRFPVGGTPIDVEQYWVDVAARNAELGVDFETVFALDPLGTNPVNPMRFVLTEVLAANVVVTSVRLSEDTPITPFFDRIGQLMPAGTLFVLQQALPEEVGDGIDTSTFANVVSAHYNVTADTDVISVPGSGTDLTYTDLSPLVVIS